jgi:hypothetical protein
MKHLCSFILAVFLAISSHAAQPEFLLNITADDVIIHNQNDWYFVTQSDGHDIYIEKSAVGSKEEVVRFHAFVPYHEPYYMYGVDVPATALYVYGSLHCGRKQLMLLMDWYVDAKNKIVFRTTYETGSHIVSLNVPNTTRFDILNLVCKESI